MSGQLVSSTPTVTFKDEVTPGVIPAGAPTEAVFSDDSLVGALATERAGNRSPGNRPGATIDGLQTTEGGITWDFAANDQTDFFLARAMRDTAGFAGAEIIASVGIDVTTTTFHGVGLFIGFVADTVYFSQGFATGANNGLFYITAATDDDITVAPWSGQTLVVEAAGASVDILGQILDDGITECPTIRIEREHAGETPGTPFTGYPGNVVSAFTLDSPDDGIVTFDVELDGFGTDGHTATTNWDTTPDPPADFSKGVLHHTTRHVLKDAIFSIDEITTLGGGVVSDGPTAPNSIGVQSMSLTWTSGLTVVAKQGKTGRPSFVNAGEKLYEGDITLFATDESILPVWLFSRRPLGAFRVFCPPNFTAGLSGASAYAFVLNQITMEGLGDRPGGSDADAPLVMGGAFSGDPVVRGGVAQGHYLRIVKFTLP